MQSFTTSSVERMVYVRNSVLLSFIVFFCFKMTFSKYWQLNFCNPKTYLLYFWIMTTLYDYSDFFFTLRHSYMDIFLLITFTKSIGDFCNLWSKILPFFTWLCCPWLIVKTFNDIKYKVTLCNLGYTKGRSNKYVFGLNIFLLYLVW